MQSYIASIGVALIFLLYILMWYFNRPVKVILKVVLKSVVGYFALFLCNTFLVGYGFCVGLNLVTTLVCGVLGINGFLLLLGLSFIC